MRLLLNGVSAGGKKVHLHVVDSYDPTSIVRKIRCSTWWAAKGTQADTVICIVPQFCSLRPLYVGLTRAFSRLCIVLYEKALNTRVCKAIAASNKSVRIDAKAKKLVKEEAANETDSFSPPERPVRACRPLDSWRAPKRVAETVFVVDEEEAKEESGRRVVVGEGREDASVAVEKMCLVLSELRATGKVRNMEDVIHPLHADVGMDADTRGLASRFVHVKRPPSDHPLPIDLLSAGKEAYARCLATRDDADLSDVAVVALSCLAWDDYVHTMRQLLPVERWCYSGPVVSAVETVLSHFPKREDAGVEYDYVGTLPCNGRVFSARCAAKSEESAFWVCWGEDSSSPSQEAMTAACVRAALHPKRTCLLVDASAGWTKRIRIDVPSGFLPRE